MRTGRTTQQAGRLRRAVAALVCLGAAGVATGSTETAAGAALSCTHTWVGAATGNWEVTGNWSPSEIPGIGATGAAQVACIPTGNTVAINEGERETLQGILGDGTIAIRRGAKLLLDGDPAVGKSRFATIRLLPGGLLGGTGTLEITRRLFWQPGSFTATMTTRDTVLIPPFGGGTTAPARFGVTRINPGATLVVNDDNATACAIRSNNGVNLRDGRRILNYGTATIEACAYVAADWGTLFTNYGTVNLDGSLGYYEGFLKTDPNPLPPNESLVWPTGPPQFNNQGAIDVAPAAAFTIAARFSGVGGTITIGANGDLRILDPVAGQPAQLSGSLDPGASGSLATCSSPAAGSCQSLIPVQSSSFVNSSVPIDATVVSQAVGVGTTYGATTKKVAGETITADASAPAGATDSYTIVIRGGAGTNPATSYNAGTGGALLPECPALGGITQPCLASRTKQGSDIVLVVKTTNLSTVITPLGPRLFR